MAVIRANNPSFYEKGYKMINNKGKEVSMKKTKIVKVKKGGKKPC